MCLGSAAGEPGMARSSSGGGSEGRAFESERATMIDNEPKPYFPGFADDVAIVTGAGRGIGAAIARALGNAGAYVIVADRDRVAANDTVSAMLAAGQRAEAYAIDIVSQEA